MKKCSKCGAVHPATKEFFYGHSQKSDGLRPDCKPCTNKVHKAYSQTDAGKEVAKKAQAKYRKTPKRKEVLNRYTASQKYRDRYEEMKTSGYTQEINRKATKKYRASAKGQAARARREARKRGATKLDNFSRQDVLDKWGTDCHICSDPIDLNNWHMDHVFPLAKGGEHSLANVKPSHPSCNMSKGAAIL